MHVAFLNPQGNFDPADSYGAGHPDFGGQLVYVKELSLALAELSVQVDIVTRRIRDSEWPEFSGDVDYYEGFPENPRILRIPCGGDSFLKKEALWPCLGEFVDNLLEQYGRDSPDFATSHYADGGYASVLLQSETGIGFSFTGHSLGAQKIDKLGVRPENAARMEETFRFSSAFMPSGSAWSGRRPSLRPLGRSGSSSIPTRSMQARWMSPMTRGLPSFPRE